MPGNSFFWKIQRGEIPRPPIAETLNAEILAYDPQARTLSSRFYVGKEFGNPTGAIQGGILTAMLDGTIGPAMGMLLGDDEFAPTLNINVSFIAPGMAGEFIASAKIISLGKSICYGTGELYDANKQLVATASATGKVVRLKK